MLQEADLDHGNANVDAVTNALQDQLGVNDSRLHNYLSALGFRGFQKHSS